MGLSPFKKPVVGERNPPAEKPLYNILLLYMPSIKKKQPTPPEESNTVYSTDEEDDNEPSPVKQPLTKPDKKRVSKQPVVRERTPPEEAPQEQPTDPTIKIKQKRNRKPLDEEQKKVLHARLLKARDAKKNKRLAQVVVEEEEEKPVVKKPIKKKVQYIVEEEEEEEEPIIIVKKIVKKKVSPPPPPLPVAKRKYIKKPKSIIPSIPFNPF